MTFPDTKRRTSVIGLKRAFVAAGMCGLLFATGLPADAAVTATPDKTATFNGTVWASAYLGDTIYLGGDFTSALVAGVPKTRNRLAAIDARTGELLPWAPPANARVKAIAVSGTSVYVAGDFSTIAGVKRDSLARVDASSGTLQAGFKHSIYGKPYALSAGNGRLYLGGAITAVNGQARTRLAAFDLLTGALDTTWKPTADDQVESLAATAGRVYLGGKFHKINGVSGSSRIAAVSPTSGKLDATFKPKASVIAFAVTPMGSGVIAVHGGQGGRAVSYDSAGATRWTTTFDGDPQAVTVLGGSVYVGGHFDNACNSNRTGDQGVCLDGAVPRVKLAALDVADGTLQPWTAHGNGVVGVLTMAVNATLGKVAAGGAFTTINGATQKRFAQFG
ncbi:MAG TPA: PQQ-binding-like beta-propeller repeat protein [Catenuloplanes sp.]